MKALKEIITTIACLAISVIAAGAIFTTVIDPIMGEVGNLSYMISLAIPVAVIAGIHEIDVVLASKKAKEQLLENA